jgi:hypothetical protein
MISRLLIRGLIAGFIAGLLSFGFALVQGEPSIDAAIAFEMHHSHDNGDPQSNEIVSRQMQAGFGLFSGLIVYGTSVGGIFSLVFAYSHGRTGKISTRSLSAWLALLAFVTLVLVPGIKYPASPPSVGSANTIDYRTKLYFIMMISSIVSMALAAKVRNALIGKSDVWISSTTAIAVYLLAVAGVMLVLPDVNEVPREFPATLLWNFRVASFGMHAILWITLGLLFGAMNKSLNLSSSSIRSNTSKAKTPNI